MPFTKMDPATFDEILSELGPDDLPPDVAEHRPSGAFEYEPAEARLEPGEIGPIARLTYDALRGMGGTTFRVEYDGGYDEGFCHPAGVRFGDGAPETPAAEVAQRLASTTGFVSQLRATVAASRAGSMYGDATSLYRDAPDRQAAQYALDELAHELASRLLGDGFGTGEYQLYGAFTADLRSGAITDDPNAPFPHDANLE